MVFTYSEILEYWIAFAITTGKVESREDISDEDMLRMVEAAKKYERKLLMREIGPMRVKE